MRKYCSHRPSPPQALILARMAQGLTIRRGPLSIDLCYLHWPKCSVRTTTFESLLNAGWIAPTAERGVFAITDTGRKAIPAQYAAAGAS